MITVSGSHSVIINLFYEVILFMTRNKGGSCQIVNNRKQGSVKYTSYNIILSDTDTHNLENNQIALCRYSLYSCRV